MKTLVSNIIFKAYQTLKDWCDPAACGNPYTVNADNLSSSGKSLFLRKRISWN
ncbi:hypothetical protein GYA28_03805 [Candidatus Roizmanbacteria bacterium]|jgi:hypothetical protein|nr:hypothetical protein [Candidatus Roizmanbacteria bacterium]